MIYEPCEKLSISDVIICGVVGVISAVVSNKIID